MSFLANISYFPLKKIDIQNVYFESEVGNSWIGLSLAAECGFMYSSVYIQGWSVLLGLRLALLARSALGLGGRT